MSRRTDPCRCIQALCFALLVAVLSSASSAQGAKSTCMSLLTADEIAKAAGEPFKDFGSQRDRSGETSCDWALRLGTPGAKAISFSFFDNAALKASPPHESPDEYFEAVVSAAESGSAKREMLPGIGVKAALVSTAPQLLVAVKRADGVGRIVGNNLTKAQMTALARAVAAP